jgi:hypothetical protein
MFMQMQKLEFIKNLVVDKANYYLEDEAGNKIELVVDYGEDAFEIKNFESIKNVEFLAEVKRFASGLLARKSRVNLAMREQYL